MTTYVSSTAANGAVVAAVAPAAGRTAAQTAGRVPLTRLVRVELQKSFDTRSGRWLLASLGLAALLTTGAIIAWAPSSQLAYSEFTLAIGVPMTIILPIIAVLSVTSEGSQRSGLATFTIVPHRPSTCSPNAQGRRPTPTGAHRRKSSYQRRTLTLLVRHVHRCARQPSCAGRTPGGSLWTAHPRFTSSALSSPSAL